MTEHAAGWLTLSSFVVVAAACTYDPGADRTQALDAGPTAIALAVPAAEVLPVYMLFDAEKARAVIAELPDQF